MSDGKPIPVRLAIAVEKRLRVFAIENDITLSDAIRLLINRGFAVIGAEVEAEPSGPSPRRRVLSKGVV